jgi:predicted phage-related endonuclease
MIKPRRSTRHIERLPTFAGKLHPKRAEDVTASVAAALFNLCPFETALGLFARKTGVDFGPDVDTKAMRRGRFLEPGVAMAFQEAHQSWIVEKANVYLRDPKARLGATPDYFFVDDRRRRGVLQCKSVDAGVFRRSWTDESAPFYIVMQTLVEAMLDDADYGIIAALVGWQCDLHEYIVPRHAGAERRIRDAARSFWKNIAEGKPPSVNYEQDGALMAMLYPRETAGLVVDLRGDNELPMLLDEREEAKEAIKEASARIERIDCEVRAKMADAETALVRDWRLTLREQHRKEYTVKATSFRVLRVAREEAKQDAA